MTEIKVCDKVRIKDRLNELCLLLDYDITYKGRVADKIIKRQTIMFILRNEYYTYPTIAKAFNMNHSSIINSVNRISSLLSSKDKKVVEYLNEVKNILGKNDK